MLHSCHIKRCVPFSCFRSVLFFKFVWFHFLFILSSDPVPRVNQTFRASGEELMEQLQRCQTEQHEVDLTLRAASPGPSPFLS